EVDVGGNPIGRAGRCAQHFEGVITATSGGECFEHRGARLGQLRERQRGQVDRLASGRYGLSFGRGEQDQHSQTLLTQNLETIELDRSREVSQDSVGRACWRTHVCMAIPEATAALMERVEPNMAIEYTASTRSRIPSDSPGPSWPNTRT